jgi:hypothetical protein
MSQERLNFSDGCLVRNTGSEGPHHDPYAFVESTIRRGDKVVTLHEGLAVWTEVDGRRTVAEPLYARRVFAEEGGLTPKQFERVFEKRWKRGCLEHGWRFAEYVRGYPGEEFCICGKCNSTISSSFDIGAVI